MIDLLKSPEPDEYDAYEQAVDDLLRRARETDHKASRNNVRTWVQQRNSDRLQPDGDHRSGHACSTAIRELANVEHILEAIEPNYRGKLVPKFVPRWINRRRLRQDIDKAGRHFQIRRKADDRVAANNQRKRVEQILRSGSELLKRIADEDGRSVFERFVWSNSFDGLRTEVRALPDILRLLIAEAEAEAETKTEWHQATISAWPLDRSPSVWLIGHRLPEVYERWIRRPAGRARPHDSYTDETGGADGPFVRFADATLKDLGILSTHGRPFSRETIAAYVREANATPRRGS